MLAICGAQLGMSTMRVTRAIELTPRARPNRAIPMGRPMAMSDPNATRRMTIAAMTPMSSPVPVCASSNVKKRSPPASICRGDPARACATVSLSASRSAVVRPSTVGYCTRMTAVVASGDTTSVVPSTCGRAAMDDSTSASESRATGSANVDVASSGVSTTCALIPPPAAPEDCSRSTAACESSPGTTNESSIWAPKVADAAMTTTAATTHAAITRHAWLAAYIPHRYR